ncbi:hypothetical protein D8674_017932 [Pyrus ussuriensis x Pyrus communis]|uniref:Uncharacterized protein n=1 Tax=Pyrus ussuriensis x Pyrus communis TaxID=2448454 RepID=A0A5N5HJF9_9ROSA|nr:hypothetical protein D8674_017932 [Pyrus ussuriensis x Pyrus communis]
MDLEPKDDPRKTSLKPSFADQHFLVNFIMGNYLGPDVNIDNLGYSAFHLDCMRVAKDSWRQFTHLFPLDLHVLVDDPVTLFMEDTALEKFKSLSAIRYQHDYLDGGESEANRLNDDGNETKTEKISNGNGNSGGNPIRKRSRVFEMKLQQLCPAGPFTLSFSLPEPVDPRLFAPNFGSDGIFEGVIVKHVIYIAELHLFLM